MSKAGFRALFQQTRESRKAVDPPALLPDAQGGQTDGTVLPLVQVDPESRGGRSAARNKRKRVQDPDAEVNIVTVEVPEIRPKWQPKKSSAPLDLDNLQASDFERCKENPYLFIAELAKAAERRVARFKEEEKKKNQASTAELEALKKVEELTGQLEATKEKFEDTLKILEPTSRKLNETEVQAARFRKERDAAETALADEVARTKELSKQVDALKKELADEKADHDLLKHSAVKYCEERFLEALKQVECRHPEIELDREVIHYSHEADGDRIILPEEVDDEGNVVYAERVIWARA